MRSVVCKHAAFDVVDGPEPTPGPGQVRLEVLRCGICGSDLHARHGIDDWADMAEQDRLRALRPLRPAGRLRPRVLRRGRRVRARLPRRTCRPGRPWSRCRCCAGAQGIDPIGLSAHAPGAYAEQVLVQESLMMPVPNGLPGRRRGADRADGGRLARRAPRRGRASATVAIVIGCGPVGLAVILLLKAKGVRTVVAATSRPAAARWPRRCGADVVVDPAEDSPYTAADGARPPHRRAGGVRAGGRHAREARAPAGRAGGTPGGSARRSAPGPSTRWSSSASACPA